MADRPPPDTLATPGRTPREEPSRSVGSFRDGLSEPLGDPVIAAIEDALTLVTFSYARPRRHDGLLAQNAVPTSWAAWRTQPALYALLDRVARSATGRPSHLAAALGLSRSTVSHELRRLEDSGLIYRNDFAVRAVARQGAAHLRADRAGLQRAASAQECAPRRGRRRSQGLARRGQAGAGATPAATGGRVGPVLHRCAVDHRRLRPATAGECQVAAGLRVRCRSRAPRHAARAARSDPPADRRAASRVPAESATRSERPPARRASRDRSTRPTQGRRAAA